ncbi:MAG: hypothetical protein IJT50_14625 [Lentisphaeria bacterium]|nr:hypothetical protein [Lentisphaeria bacterium]
MKVKIDVFDDLIEKIFNTTPEEFDREMIEKHRKKADDLLREYELTDPWNFIKRAWLLNRIGECTRKIKFYRQNLKEHQAERNARSDIA